MGKPLALLACFLRPFPVAVNPGLFPFLIVAQRQSSFYKKCVLLVIFRHISGAMVHRLRPFRCGGSGPRLVCGSTLIVTGSLPRAPSRISA